MPTALGLGLHARYSVRRPRVSHPELPRPGQPGGLAIEIGFSLPSRQVLALLGELVALHGAPSALRLDNSPEFLAMTVSTWAEQRGIQLDFIQPGKPAQNAFIELSTRPIAPRWSAPSRRTDSVATTPSGPMTASAGCRPSPFCRGQQAPSSPPIRCLPDGGAYRPTAAPRQQNRQPLRASA